MAYLNGQRIFLLNKKALTQPKTVVPTTSQQVFTPDIGYGGFDTVTVEAVTSNIDPNILPRNIKKDVTILGVTGTFDEGASPILSKVVDKSIDIIEADDLGSITSIGAYAFYNCRSLTDVAMPNTITIINVSAFEECRALANLTLSSALTGIASKAFYYCKSLVNITIPSTVTQILQSAFYDCTKLETVTFEGTSINKIRFECFSGCSKLTSINLPNGFTTLEASTFAYCSLLPSITIPASVTKIEHSAFISCLALGTVIINGDSVKTLDNSNAFSDTLIANGTGYIYVKDSLVDTYKSATNWSTYASVIKGISELEA